MKASINVDGHLCVMAENKEENLALTEWFKKSEIPLYADFPILCFTRGRDGFLEQIL